MGIQRRVVFPGFSLVAGNGCLVCLARLVPFCSTGDFPDSVRRTEDTERRLSGSCVSSLVFGRLSQGCAADRCFRESHYPGVYLDKEEKVIV